MSQIISQNNFKKEQIYCCVYSLTTLQVHRRQVNGLFIVEWVMINDEAQVCCVALAFLI